MTSAPDAETEKDSGSTSPQHPDSRMHRGGKLSFRRRVPHVEDKDLPLTIGGESPPALSKLVPAGFEKVEIEVGTGKGTFLLAGTAARPDTFLLGIEAALAYARYAAERLKKQERGNGYLLVDNAKLFLADRVEAGELDRLHVYFPDPWPKRRHRKRRFFTDEVPAVIHRVLKPGGWLLVCTDNAAYAGEIARVVGSSPLLVRDPDEEERLLRTEPGHGFSPTNFEKKYQAEGRIIRRYAFRRV
ncbi:MAG: class I SAM-dependent methyltransferase [Planctomycetota bacterium]|jgi:tRNA (guanine-N7-)-methyltransferase